MAKILVIDHIEIIVEIQRALKDLEHEVIACPMGEGALEIYEKSKPDLVIIEPLVSDSDGWRLLEQIVGLSDIPVIVVTSLSEVDDIDRALDLGADGYIKKPYGSKELAMRIESCLVTRND